MNKRTIVLAIFYSLQAGLCLADETAHTPPVYTFTTDELQHKIQTAVDGALKTHNINLPTEHTNNLTNAAITKLRDYRVTGFSFCLDPNFAFFFERQNPSFVVYYKNSMGGVKSRVYDSAIYTFGAKIELSLKLDLVFFVGTDINFFDSNKEIVLFPGFDANLAAGGGIGITCANFANMDGGLVILSIPLFLAAPSFSFVLGGSIWPRYFELLP
ncbi:hypothetical protein K2X40_03865 [Candidatus Babeliales bacterium]|nr:hypothetical protein [Candidatus Babeliales bacterium]